MLNWKCKIAKRKTFDNRTQTKMVQLYLFRFRCWIHCCCSQRKTNRQNCENVSVCNCKNICHLKPIFIRWLMRNIDGSRSNKKTSSSINRKKTNESFISNASKFWRLIGCKSIVRVVQIGWHFVQLRIVGVFFFRLHVYSKWRRDTMLTFLCALFTFFFFYCRSGEQQTDDEIN